MTVKKSFDRLFPCHHNSSTSVRNTLLLYDQCLRLKTSRYITQIYLRRRKRRPKQSNKSRSQQWPRRSRLHRIISEINPGRTQQAQHRQSDGKAISHRRIHVSSHRDFQCVSFNHILRSYYRHNKADSKATLKVSLVSCTSGKQPSFHDSVVCGTDVGRDSEY